MALKEEESTSVWHRVRTIIFGGVQGRQKDDESLAS